MRKPVQADPAIAPMLTFADVMALTGFGRATIYTKMRNGSFPVAIKVSKQAVRWMPSEIDEWLASLPRATGREAA